MFYRLHSEQGKQMLKNAYNKLQHPKLKERRFEEVGTTKRNEFHRDFTRILYSASFRRLQGKMQILGIQNDAFFRNRLTHSLEVSQIARDIASRLGKVIGNKAYTNSHDLYVIEAAALAHDIGHPAFGHSGERVLDNICKNTNLGRFEGNAHNFTIVNDIEQKLYNEKGLNLTYRTLFAINKYLVQETKDVKKFIYKEDYELLMPVREETDLIQERTLDVQIIDIADEIAYAVHDLEDALALGYFNIDELTYLLKDALKDNEKCFNKFKTIVRKAKAIAKTADVFHTSQEYSQLFRKNLISKLTNTFIVDIGFVRIADEAKIVHGTPNVEYELGCCEWGELVHALKDVIYNAVTRHDNIKLYEKRGSIVIKKLYEIYSQKENYQLLSPDYRPNINYKSKEVTDAEQIALGKAAVRFIAGMMDNYAKAMYKRYYNVEFDDIPIND